MKSSVKDASVARMRLGAMAALGLGGAAFGCKSAPPNDGLVVAPMLQTALASPSGSADEADAAVAHRPTVDPRAPRNMKCERQVDCRAELAVAPSWPFTAPYERCDPMPVGELGKFSPTETASHRHGEPGTCCYLAFVACESAGSRSNSADWPR